MKKKILMLTAIVLCLTFASLGTIAYYTAEDEAQNRIVAGDVSIQIVELTDATDENGEPIPFENLTGVMPGAEISKIAMVENTGSNSVYVRVSVETVIEFAQETDEIADLSLVALDFNTEDWTYSDGYYYYNSVLAPGASTEPLFTTVAFAPSMGNIYQNSTASVNLIAQATKSAKNGANALEASGWPE